MFLCYYVIMLLSFFLLLCTSKRDPSDSVVIRNLNATHVVASTFPESYCIQACFVCCVVNCIPIVLCKLNAFFLLLFYLRFVILCFTLVEEKIYF